MAAPICKLSINERKQNNCQGKIWQIKENQFNILERSQYGYLKFFFFFSFFKEGGEQEKVEAQHKVFLRETHMHGLDICQDIYSILSKSYKSI